MIKKNTLLLLLIFTFSISNLFSQDLWNKVESKSFSFQDKDALYIKNFPNKYSLMNLNLEGFKNTLNNLKSKNNLSQQIISLPNSNGELKRFSIKETPYLAAELAAKFPSIKSFSAQGIDDPTATAKVSLGSDGVHAIIFSGKESTIYIDPYSVNRKKYIVYKRSELNANDDEFSCGVKETINKKINTNLSQQKNADDGMLRTYRLAIVCSGEYAQFHLNRQGVASSATDAVKKAAVLSAMNTSMTRINGVYEKDLGVKMVIVSDNDKVIFLDPSTDNYY